MPGECAIEAGDRLADQIDRLYWLALSRPPTGEEKSIILDELEKAYEAGTSQPDRREAAHGPLVSRDDQFERPLSMWTEVAHEEIQTATLRPDRPHRQPTRFLSIGFRMGFMARH